MQQVKTSYAQKDTLFFPMNDFGIVLRDGNTLPDYVKDSNALAVLYRGGHALSGKCESMTPVIEGTGLDNVVCLHRRSLLSHLNVDMSCIQLNPQKDE